MTSPENQGAYEKNLEQFKKAEDDLRTAEQLAEEAMKSVDSSAVEVASTLEQDVRQEFLQARNALEASVTPELIDEARHEMANDYEEKVLKELQELARERHNTPHAYDTNLEHTKKWVHNYAYRTKHGPFLEATKAAQAIADAYDESEKPPMADPGWTGHHKPR
jgi:hypothetical protein